MPRKKKTALGGAARLHEGETINLPKGTSVTPKQITGTLKPHLHNGATSPHLFTDAKAPRNGTRITFKTQSGKVVSGLVAHSFEADGKTVIGFKGGLTVEK